MCLQQMLTIIAINYEFLEKMFYSEFSLSRKEQTHVKKIFLLRLEIKKSFELF